MEAPAYSLQPHATARHTYDRLSGWYDLLARSERKFVRQGVEMLALQPGESSLEIGPGTGHALLALARAVGPLGQVYGVDISPGMLHQAKQKLSRAGLSRPVRLVCADGARLALESSCFDAALLSFTLELFDTPDIPLVLGECRRVLRDGGRLCVVALAREGGSRLMLRLYNWAHARFPTWVDCRPILPARLLQDNGFRIQEVVRGGMWGLPVQVVLASRAP